MLSCSFTIKTRKSCSILGFAPTTLKRLGQAQPFFFSTSLRPPYIPAVAAPEESSLTWTTLYNVDANQNVKLPRILGAENEDYLNRLKSLSLSKD